MTKQLLQLLLGAVGFGAVDGMCAGIDGVFSLGDLRIHYSVPEQFVPVRSKPFIGERYSEGHTGVYIADLMSAITDGKPDKWFTIRAAEAEKGEPSTDDFAAFSSFLERKYAHLKLRWHGAIVEVNGIKWFRFDLLNNRGAYRIGYLRRINERFEIICALGYDVPVGLPVADLEDVSPGAREVEDVLRNIYCEKVPAKSEDEGDGYGRSSKAL